MNYSTPFVHAFETDNYKYLYDVNTNRTLQVNDIIYDIIPYYGNLSTSEIVNRFQDKYDLNTIEQGIKDIEAAKSEGLFSSFRPKRIRYPKDRLEIIDLLETEIGSIALNVTENCNMRCKYCVYGGNYKMVRVHSKKYMSFDIAKKAIDYCLLHLIDSEIIGIAFYGGEPLLNFNLIQDCVEYVKAYKIDTENIFYNLTTNGTRLNDRIIDFLIENNFNLLVSLDGSKSIHDRYRIFPDGTGTFGIIMENLRKIRLKNPDYYQNNVGFVVVAAPPVDYVQIDEFFSHSEMIEVNNRINVSAVNPGSVFLEQFNQEELRDAQGSEKLWRKYTDGLLQHVWGDPLSSWGYLFAKSMFETRFLTIYRCFPEKSLKKNHYAGGICIPGHHKLFVSSEGLFYVCERVHNTGSENDLYCIGNVETGIDHDKVLKLIDDFCSVTELDCCRCWAARLCSMCFTSVMPNDDQEITPPKKKEVCVAHRQSVHDSLVKFYSVIESDPKVFDFMDDSIRMVH